MRPLVPFVLFFVSFSPLFIYKGITSSDLKLTIENKNLNFSWDYMSFALCCAVSIASIIFLLCILNSIKKSAPSAYRIQKAKKANADFLAYVITYLFGFMGLNINPANISELLGSVFLMCVMAALYAKSDMIHTNPVLGLLGYNIFEAELNTDTQNIETITILSKADSFNLEHKIPLTRISNNLYTYFP